MSFKWYFWQKKYKKILMSVLGLNSKDRKSTRDKASISNPKINRACTPLTANRTSADCVQISLGPSIPYIPLGVYHTGGFKAMYSLKTRRLTDIGIPIMNQRRLHWRLRFIVIDGIYRNSHYKPVAHDRLRFIMGIPIPIRQRLLVNRGPEPPILLKLTQV